MGLQLFPEIELKGGELEAGAALGCGKLRDLPNVSGRNGQNNHMFN